MDIIKLIIIFALILILLAFKKPLWLAIGASIILSFFIFRIPIKDAVSISIHSVFSWSTISVILSFYTITFLQRMLESRNSLLEAESAINDLFRNRRITAMLAPIFIGLLPSAGAVYICGAIVDSACGDMLSKEDKTFVTSYYRHIPESFLPTYSSILIALGLTGIAASSFILSMLPVVALLIALGYLFYLRKLPKGIDGDCTVTKGDALKKLGKNLWTIFAAIVIIIAFNIPVYMVTPGVIVAAFFIHRFKFKEIKPFFISAFELKIVVNTFLIMIFKDILTYTGVISQLPAIFSSLPIPTYVAFALIFFFGAIIGGATAIIVLCLPLAYAAIPSGGVALMMLLMSCSYCAMQMSPTHICLALVTDYFKTSMGDLLKRTLPVMMIFFVAILIYYNVLIFIL